MQWAERAEKTISDYKFILNKFFTFCEKPDPRSVNPVDLSKFLTEIKPGLKNNTFFIYTAKLKTFFRVYNLPLVEWMKKNVKVKIKESVVEALPRQTLFDLANYFATRTRKEGWHMGDTWETIHWFLVATGCRVGELCKLNIGDIVEDQKEMQYRVGFRAETTKTGKKRATFIPVGSLAGCALHTYLLKYRVGAGCDEPLFLNALGHRFSPLRIDVKYQAAAKALGIKTKCTPHVLRHTYCTFLQEKNVDPKVASELTGHSVVTYLKTYGHPSERRKQQITKTYQIV